MKLSLISSLRLEQICILRTSNYGFRQPCYSVVLFKVAIKSNLLKFAMEISFYFPFELSRIKGMNLQLLKYEYIKLSGFADPKIFYKETLALPFVLAFVKEITKKMHNCVPERNFNLETNWPSERCFDT